MKGIEIKDKPKMDRPVIGLACSAYDLFHAGHMLMLKDAKRVCDHLIVGLQIDPSVEDASYRGKKKNVPVLSEDERKILLEGCKYVDEIFTYTDEKDLFKKIKNLKFDVRVVGSDWKGKNYTASELPHLVYYHDRDWHGYSTSSLRKRIWEAEEREKQINPSRQ